MIERKKNMISYEIKFLKNLILEWGAIPLKQVEMRWFQRNSQWKQAWEDYQVSSTGCMTKL
jgi:hypothetical protein